MSLKMLNVGCGSYFDRRWTNIDIYSTSPDVIQHDITQGLPFSDQSFDVVYHSHILEHLDRESSAFLMRECYRILKPNGILRVVVPDLEFSCKLYLQSLENVLKNETPTDQEHYEWSVLNLFDQMVRNRPGGEIFPFISRENLTDMDFIVENGGGTVIKEIREAALNPSASATPSRSSSLLRRALNPQDFGQLVRKALLRLLAGKTAQQINFRQMGEIHQWMYDPYSMRRLFQATGFRTVQIVSPDQSAIADWSAYNLDVRPDGSVHKPNSLFAEAVK